MKDKLENLYKECMDVWGFEAQSRVAQEECGELITAISHLLRERECGLEEVIEETADVYLMVHQLMYYLGEERVMAAVEYKAKGIWKRIEKEKMETEDGN